MQTSRSKKRGDQARLQSWFDDVARRNGPKYSVEDAENDLGKIVRLPNKAACDPVMRLEQNLGCELPVCVSNRRDVDQACIEILAGDDTVWRLTRSAVTLLPAPEHYPYWLWFLDRCHAAAEAGEDVPPRISFIPSDLADFAGNGRKSKRGGSWFNDIDEAFRRFSNLIVSVARSFHSPHGEKYESCTGTLGTLCTYMSWRHADTKDQHGGQGGWIAPGPLLWTAIRGGYLKAVSMAPLQQLESYVAQRLMTYLSKHCKPGGIYKVSLAKLMPKIPLQCSAREAKRTLRPHHESLIRVGFLSEPPLFEGRGCGLMVTYRRSAARF